jgi:hypothetical protein
MPTAGPTGYAGGLSRLAEADIAKLFDPKIFERGREYFEEGRVLRPIVYRGSLMADVQGTMPEEYHISVDVRDGNFIASCTCPYAFGYCKHIAAVLYAWVKRPSVFKDLGRSEDALKKLGKEEVVEIVMDMIRYDPDVLYVISLRLTPAPELPAYVDREIKSIFSEEYVDYLNVREVVKKLGIFREYALDLARGGDLNTALAVIVPVVDAAIENYTKLDDADGLMKNFFGGALDMLGNALARTADVGRRRTLLTRLVDWYMEAEWGLEGQLRPFLKDLTLRLKEARFVTNTIDVKAADFRRSFISTSPLYSEEHEYLDERLRRLAALRADLRLGGASKAGLPAT